MITAVELGVLYGIMALGVYLTFRILEFPDLTVDGSFTTGAAVATVGVVNGVNPVVSTLLALAAGLLAGAITGLLHTKGKIDGLLAGIITQLGLYSINLKIMAISPDGNRPRSNIPLLRETTLWTPLRDADVIGTWWGPLALAPITIISLVLVIWFLHTSVGLAMRATGDNPTMIQSFGVSTDTQKMLGLSLSNGLVGLSGALVAQYQGFADIGMGIGMIVAGLASVIIGQAIFGRMGIWRAATAAVLGSIAYRIVIQLALAAGIDPNDMKLISAILVVLALVIPQWKYWDQIAHFFRRSQNPEMDAATRETDPLLEPVDGEPTVREESPLHESDFVADPIAHTGAELNEEGR